MKINERLTYMWRSEGTYQDIKVDLGEEVLRIRTGQ